ncbi:hypothetical protein [Thermococcus sp. 9N3]|uniref:hypothetical protein n=1 Tax=Thermococcus sp. 9N3 TaxID=163002 RepID=UPI0014312238|nr:hypothetical protein [Thermococcus sp. 9N3]NJE49529.1 hypothetical protein [Thermococcus sp. 9N3]
MERVVGVNVINELIGGSMENGSVMSILYDAYSLGWVLGFEVFRALLDEGFFGVIHNYSLPVPRLVSRASFVGLNIPKLAKKDSLRIVDIFGSRYGIPPADSYVIKVDNPSEDTLTPKIEKVYRDVIYPISGGRGIIKLIYTLDGAVIMFGERPTLRLLNSEVAFLARESVSRRISTILLLNTDVVSERLVAWVSSISDTMVAFRSSIREDTLVERMLILKTPSPSFEPTTYEFRLSTRNGKVHLLHFERLN